MWRAVCSLSQDEDVTMPHSNGHVLETFSAIPSPLLPRLCCPHSRHPLGRRLMKFQLLRDLRVCNRKAVAGAVLVVGAARRDGAAFVRVLLIGDPSALVVVIQKAADVRQLAPLPLNSMVKVVAGVARPVPSDWKDLGAQAVKLLGGGNPITTSWLIVVPEDGKVRRAPLFFVCTCTTSHARPAPAIAGCSLRPVGTRAASRSCVGHRRGR